MSNENKIFLSKGCEEILKDEKFPYIVHDKGYKITIEKEV